MYHDHAFQISGDGPPSVLGNNIVAGSRLAFKALLNTATQAFFNSIHEVMTPIYNDAVAFTIGVEAKETIRLWRSRTVDVTNREFRMFLSIACLFVGRQIKVEIELSFMYLLIALSKGSSIDARFLLRKVKSFKTQRAYETSDYIR